MKQGKPAAFDSCHELIKSEMKIAHVERMASITITSAETSQMLAVKAATFKE